MWNHSGAWLQRRIDANRYTERVQNLAFPLRSAFIAIPLEGDSKHAFQAALEVLRPHEEILSLQSGQTPHLTLQFWPSLMEIEYGQVLGQAAKIAAKAHPFSCKAESVDTFGTRGRDHVLFIHVPFSDALARLRKLCPWPSEKPFHPHITLAHIRHPERFHRVKKRVMKDLADVSFELPVSGVRLYAEIDGHKQMPLQDFVFAH